MQPFLFTLRYLIKGRGNNTIKLISLSLGLAVGILLLTHIAYEKSFDTSYPDHERIYQVRSIWKTPEEAPDESWQLNQNVVPTFVTEFPEIESGARYFGGWPFNYFYEESLFPLATVVADSSIFNVLGIPILQGDPKALGLVNNIAISDKAARMIFGNRNPIGQNLMYNRTLPQTIVAVFKELPENVSLRYDVVMSFENAKGFGISNNSSSWDGGDTFGGYVKLKKETDTKQIEAKIPAMLHKYYDVEAEKASGVEISYFFKPVTEIHMDDDLSQTVFILSLLALLILFVAGMNYVLISVSSLATRARTMAVYKCNGASTGDIFGMFLRETGVLTATALIIAVLLIAGLKQQIATLTVVHLPTLSLQNLWPAGVAIVVLFLLSAIVPAAMFSSIPVTQAFHKYAGGKKYWKQALLFTQFAVSAFMVALLFTSVRQYNTMMNKKLGYDYDKIVYVYLPDELSPMIKNEVKSLPFVEDAAVGSPPCKGFSGQPIYDDQGNWIISSRLIDGVDQDYLALMDIKLKYGSNFSENTPKNGVIVTEELVRQVKLKENPVGETLSLGYDDRVQIIGVTKDLYIGSPLYSNMPAIIFHSDTSNCVMIKLNEINPDNIAAINRKFAEIFGNNDLSVNSFSQTFLYMYEDIQRFRNSILSTAAIALIITLMGLLGYVNDELQRRSKEIAIRKINGARARDVIRLVSRDTALVSVPAVLVGLGGAYYASSLWLQQFANKVSLSPWILLLCGLLVLLIAASAIVLKTWKTANENPVKAIKSE